MRDIILDYTCLAPIFLLDKSLEQIPEPFRMQGNHVSFTVPFSEYKTFVKCNLRKKDYLASPTALLKKYESSNDTENMFRCYLRDMSVAVCKELHYSTSNGKEATIIKHSCDGSISLSLDEISKVYDRGDTYDAELRNYMQDYGFDLPSSWTLHNHRLFTYAYFLWRKSTEDVRFWEVSV